MSLLILTEHGHICPGATCAWEKRGQDRVGHTQMGGTDVGWGEDRFGDHKEPGGRESRFPVIHRGCLPVVTVTEL